MSPRLGILICAFIAATYTPMAQASGCIDVEFRNFGDGLHVIADSGRELAFGFVTGYPGEGVGAVIIITPSLCAGVGAGFQSIPDLLEDTADSANPAVEDAMLLLPLP